MKKISEKFEETKSDLNLLVRKEFFEYEGRLVTRITHYRRWYIESPTGDKDGIY